MLTAARSCQQGVMLDITRRKEAERELAESQRLHTEIVQSTPAGLLVYDFEEPDRFRLADSNRAAEELTGAGVPRDRGRLFRELWPE